MAQGSGSFLKGGIAVATDMKSKLREYYAAWGSHDVERLASYFTDDLLYDDVPMGIVQHNKEEFKASFTTFFASCPDFTLELKGLLVADDRAGSEWVMTGTHAGDWPGMPATGKSFSIRGASIIELRDDKIRREALYWDAVSLMQQLGFMPQVPSP
jgi:steroid delta-isomerase-like uncharacterized protein